MHCMQAFVYEDGEFEVNPFTNLQPMESTKNRSDVIEESHTTAALAFAKCY